MLERIPFLRGTTPWILMDFRSPRRQLPRVQDFFNRKGLVSERGQKKKAFFVLQRYYRELAARWAAQANATPAKTTPPRPHRQDARTQPAADGLVFATEPGGSR